MRSWRRKDREQDLERELAAHLEAEAAEQRDNGLSPEQARYAARRAFGNPALLKEQTRETWAWTAWEAFAKDILYSLRAIRNNPRLAVIAISCGPVGWCGR